MKLPTPPELDGVDVIGIMLQLGDVLAQQLRDQAPDDNQPDLRHRTRLGQIISLLGLAEIALKDFTDGEQKLARYLVDVINDEEDALHESIQ